MERVFGFDIGTTSIGFAVIDHDERTEVGRIHRLGVRIFPEARDVDGAPFNQARRQKRMVRRQLRRRRARRRRLNELLCEAGLLPAFGSPEWPEVMRRDPYPLRRCGLSEALSPFEFGRALYHLAQRRHFRGRDVVEVEDGEAEDSDEVEAKSARDETLARLKKADVTLGTWLAGTPPHERRRGVHASRGVVSAEFERLRAAQAPHHAVCDKRLKESVADTIFAQRPVFWRKSTLGACRFVPGAPLCAKGSWLSQQRRMLEKLNNLEIAGGNGRPLDREERAAILARLESAPHLPWSKVREALKPLFKARGEAGAERRLKFNLEVGGDSRLLGNAVEARLAGIFGEAWPDHPHRQALRDTVPERLRTADYGEVGGQRVVILSDLERRANRAAAAAGFATEFQLTVAQAEALAGLTLPAGWEPYSTDALMLFLPKLEAGIRFGALTTSPDHEAWRAETFPGRVKPTGEFLDRLPSPAEQQESERIARLRNPTVVRTQNELRKVVNNLIRVYGKPDRIRVEVARDVGLSKREREEKQAGIRRQEGRRRKAEADLKAKGIAEPSRDDIEKWMLWEECGHRCPYTGESIGFDALFGQNLFDVEHIWPRSRSFDNSFRNKTLCRRDINILKAGRTPFEAFGLNAEAWDLIRRNLDGMAAKGRGPGMPPGKVKRFLARDMPEGFTSRQLVDTGYAAREAVAMLKRLWPDVGPTAPVRVEPVTGRVTAQLRRLWGLNNVLAEDGEKTRADHRHHAIDALTVACTHPGMTNRLSRYWQLKDEGQGERPTLLPPWASIRGDAERAVAEIVVSHRVRKKASGPLHKESVYGDTGEDIVSNRVLYRVIVQRTPIESLTKADLDADDLASGKYVVRDPGIRRVLRAHVAHHGGDIKKAMADPPRLGPDGPVIRKVRLVSKRQVSGLSAIHNGFVDNEAKHHLAIYRSASGAHSYEIVSLLEAARRIARREPILRKTNDTGDRLVMSLAKGDMVTIDDDRAPYWTVREIMSNGQVTLVPHTDARPTRQAVAFMPTARGLMSRNAVKLSVDPIGRIRRAYD